MKRREFFNRVGRSCIGAGLGLTVLRSSVRAAAPSDRVVMGHIGVGGMGNQHVSWFSGFDDVAVAALCDVDEGHLGATAQELKKRRPNQEVALYGDFRKLLERDDIDAVSIATPDHWHALAAIHAFKAGKDVYSEKPLCYSLKEGRAMLAAQGKQVFQLGTQIHEGENYHRVVELVRSGVLGKIHTVRVWKTGGAPFLPPTPDADPPKGLNWDMWLGPRPSRPYNSQRCHFTFRYFWDYSGGMYADFWCHISDIVFWALELGAPTTVEARGQLNKNGMAETHEWLDVDLTFGDLKYFWTTNAPKIAGAEGRGIGACFEGTKGHLVVDYGSRELFLEGKKIDSGDLSSIPTSIPRSPGHQRNFIECVRSRKLTESNLPYAHTMTTPMHLGLVSFWTGRKLTWDGAAEKCVNDAEADQYLLKPFRPPWALPSA
jgi:predicted dehydrogenase